jgi:hypothetical protein
MPRYVGLHQGSFSQDSVQDIVDGDSLQGNPIYLTGTADAINPHVSGNYIVDNQSAADLMTIGAPTDGVDDNLSINIWSDSTFVHTLTAPSAIFANGAALATVVTFKAFRGSGLTLRAMDGAWHVLASNVTSIS